MRFGDAGSRDIVQSYALNLAKHRDRAGIRLEIPPQLAGTFRLFEEHARALRAQFPQGLKRSVKFDDISMDLVMDIKVPTATRWHRFTRQQIEQASRSRQNDVSGQSGQSPNDAAERESILMQPTTNSSTSGSAWQSAKDYVEVDDEESGENA